MPDSAGNIEEIQNSLKASLGGGRNSLDEDVVAASKRVLLHHLEFEPASTPYAMQREELRAKYSPLNPTPSLNKGWSPGTSQHQGLTSSSPQSEKNGEHLPTPRVVLYPEEKVKMEWGHAARIGAGLFNLGNTCFFNSTLQCLTYTAPLVNYCYTSDHKEKCRKKDFCMMCEIQKHIKVSLNCGGRPIKPHSILQKLRCIAKHMKWGRQEDAHEFLRFVVDHLQQACLNGESKLDRFSKETTVINQIFGGYLRSQVTCLRCQGKSNTFDPFMDLSLDIKGVNSVEEALGKYVKPETLDFDNAYMCPKCKNKVRAQKRMSIQKPPNILTLQLNRFDFNRHLAGKMTKFIRYPEKINLRNFMSQRQGEPVLYHLYGVIVHSGYSSDHGHYYSYVKSATKMWFCMNDASVHQVNLNTVFNADAYVLFYARINKGNSSSSSITGSSTPNSIHVKSGASSMKGAQSSSGLVNHVKQDRSPVVNGIHAQPSSEMGTPIKRAAPAQATPKIVPHATAVSTLPGSHSKISFPILTSQQRKQLEREEGKRIVLQIKDGNSTTMEKSPDGKSKLVNGWRDHSAGGLVPYKDDSDSEQENHSGSSVSNRSNGGSHNSTQSWQAAKFAAAGDGLSVCGKPKTIAQLPSERGDADHKKNGHKWQTDASSSHSQQQSHTTSSSPSSLSPAKKKLSIIPASKGPSAVSEAGGPSTTTVAGKGPPWTGKGKGLVSPLELAPLVSVSSSCSPVKATNNWVVQPQDPSPSPKESCSSTNSINSTTEWTVEAKESSAMGPTKTANGKPSWSSSDHFARALFPSSSAHSQSHSSMAALKEGGGTSSSSTATSRASPEGGDRTPVAVSDRQTLLSPSSSENSTRKKHKNKKHKKKIREDSQQDDSSSRSDSSHKKKKKKKEKKERKMLHKSSGSVDSDSSSDHRRKRQNSDSSSDSDRHRHKRKRKYSSEDSEQYVWVEKKVEPPVKHKHNKVVEQRWNSLTADDVAPRREEKVKGNGTHWDGSRTSKVAQFLGASNHGLANVKSWDGSHSHVNGDKGSDKSLKKKHWAEDYNESIDAGKVKKVKKHREEENYNGYNPFQNHYSSKVAEKKSWWSEDHSYYQPPSQPKKTYPAQPWLNSDFDPRHYQVSSKAIKSSYH